MKNKIEEDISSEDKLDEVLEILLKTPPESKKRSKFTLKS